MKTEWIKAIITQLFVLFLFIALNAEIMGWFDEYILPTLSIVNEGLFASIIFGAMCLSMIIFWFNRFKHHYYVKPVYVLSSITLSSVYWFYRLFTDEYVVIESDIFHIGFSDIIYSGLFLFGIISLIIDLIELDESTPDDTQKEDKISLEDRPITKREQDRLGFGDEVDTLYQRIIERKTTTALSIGINARWGDGKSSFINLMEEKFLQNKDRFIVIRFNPRYSTNDTIQSAFFEKFYSELSKYDSRFKSSFNDYLRVIDVMTDNKYLSALFHTSTLFNRDSEKSRINEAIKRIKRRIIVIIEDLDRLTGDEIVEVFKLIDGNAAFDNLIFISAYDKRRINSLLETTDEWAAFSDKFFTWELPLPLRSSQLLLDFLISNLTSGLTFKNKELEEINSSIIANSSFFTYYLKNLRDVKRYINLVKPSVISKF
jgi:P-loop domain protein, KAP family